MQDLSYDLLVRRLARERAARVEAERLLEQKSLQLYETNQDLAASVAKFNRERLLLSAVFDARPNGLVLTDNSGQVVRLNPWARKLFGVPDQRPEGLTFTDFVTGPDDVRAWIAARTKNGADHDDGAVEGAVIQQDGDPIPVRITCTAVDHDDLRLWILVDIRKQRTVEAEKKALEQSLNQAQKMEALGTLASGVAHEINTPIQYVGDNVRFLQEVCRTLTGLLQAYDSLKSAAEGKGLFDDITRAIADQRDDSDIDFLLDEAPSAIDQSLHGLQQVASIVSAIREFSHPGEAESKPVDLHVVIETTLAVSRNSWKHVADIELDLATDLPEIMGHPSDLHQVLMNLIGNAVDAIEEQEPKGGGRICIATRRTGDWIELSVADNGTGIKDKANGRIFDPFFTTKEPGKGTGQGLAIVYKIVETRHGGRISVESKPGKGATFTLRLPIPHDSETETTKHG